MKHWRQMGSSAHLNYYMASLGLQESLKWYLANQGYRHPRVWAQVTDRTPGDKITWQEQLKEERGKGLSGLTIWGYTSSWWGRHGSRDERQLVTLCGSQERWLLLLTSSLPFDSSWDPSPWDGPAQIQGLSSLVHKGNPRSMSPGWVYSWQWLVITRPY